MGAQNSKDPSHENTALNNQVLEEEEDEEQNQIDWSDAQLYKNLENESYGKAKLIRKQIGECAKYCVVLERLTQDKGEFFTIWREAERRKVLFSGIPQVVQFLQLRKSSENEYCGQFYKLEARLEYLPFTLSEDIKNRKTARIKFREVEIITMIQQVAKGIHALKEIEINHEKISPKTILVNKSGIYKVADISLFNCNEVSSEYVQFMLGCQQDCYLSPELLSSLEHRQIIPQHHIEKSQIFSLGLCALEMALMSTVQQIYDFHDFKIESDVLNKLILSLEAYYSNRLIDMIISMLDLNFTSRLSFQQLELLSQNYLLSRIVTTACTDKTTDQNISKMSRDDATQREQAKQNILSISQKNSKVRSVPCGSTDQTRTNQTNEKHSSQGTQNLFNNFGSNQIVNFDTKVRGYKTNKVEDQDIVAFDTRISQQQNTRSKERSVEENRQISFQIQELNSNKFQEQSQQQRMNSNQEQKSKNFEIKDENVNSSPEQNELKRSKKQAPALIKISNQQPKNLQINNYSLHSTLSNHQLEGSANHSIQANCSKQQQQSQHQSQQQRSSLSQQQSQQSQSHQQQRQSYQQQQQQLHEQQHQSQKQQKQHQAFDSFQENRKLNNIKKNEVFNQEQHNNVPQITEKVSFMIPNNQNQKSNLNSSKSLSRSFHTQNDMQQQQPKERGDFKRDKLVVDYQIKYLEEQRENNHLTSSYNNNSNNNNSRVDSSPYSTKYLPLMSKRSPLNTTLIEEQMKKNQYSPEVLKDITKVSNNNNISYNPLRSPNIHKKGIHGNRDENFPPRPHYFDKPKLPYSQKGTNLQISTPNQRQQYKSPLKMSKNSTPNNHYYNQYQNNISPNNNEVSKNDMSMLSNYDLQDIRITPKKRSPLYKVDLQDTLDNLQCRIEQLDNSLSHGSFGNTPINSNNSNSFYYHQNNQYQLPQFISREFISPVKEYFYTNRDQDEERQLEQYHQYQQMKNNKFMHYY